VGNSYPEGSTAQQNYVIDPAVVVPGVQEVGLENYAGGMDGITVNAADVLIGQWDSNATPRFTQSLLRPDAVSVTVRREAAANGPIASIFARVFGIDTFDVRADATAALSGQGTSGPGDLELPIGISAFFFDGYGCNDWIKFSPTNDPDSCAGWTSWDYNSNDVTLRRILDEEEGYESPATIAGEDTSNFIGGDLSTPTFDALLNLFRRKGYDYDPDTGLPIQVDGEGLPVPGHLEGLGVPLYADDGVTPLLYPDGTPRNYHKWETLVVVYDWHDCANPNTAIVIAGYATIVLIDVLGPPDKLLRGVVLCDLVSDEPTRGGGGEYGTMGSIPGRVE
jgi:hypothetical protein